MQNQRFVIPFHFKGAPNQSVMIECEIRFVKKDEHEHFGKCTVYLDSQYNPVIDALDAISPTPYVTHEQAESILKAHGAIAVKADFDRYSIEDLREIKGQLSREWIDDFNAALKAYS